MSVAVLVHSARTYRLEDGGSMRTVSGQATDVGCVRKVNEDAVLSAPPVFAVADGMGGHAAGEVAAAMALEHLADLGGRTNLQVDDIEAAIRGANAAIVRSAATHGEQRGMGTTLSGACLTELDGVPHWYIFNIGDSRVYGFVEGALTQITTDHSEVEELVQAGQITAEQARTHPMRNVVTRSLGASETPTPDLWVLPTEDAATLLICSDGLTSELADDEIAQALSAAPNPQAAADLLVHQALVAGARDNVSAVVVTLEDSLTSRYAGEACVETTPRRTTPRAIP